MKDTCLSRPNTFLVTSQTALQPSPDASLDYSATSGFWNWSSSCICHCLWIWLYL